MDARPRVELLIFQTTPFCNINCSYCYLPDRLSKERIPLAVVSMAAQRIVDAGWVGEKLSVVWHAGEPLTVGPEYLEQLIEACSPLEQITRIQQCVQTNALLINPRFCELFKGEKVRVGVSIDGPRDLHDRHRTTRGGKGTFDAVMRGIDKLREYGIDFSVICVLTSHSLSRAEEIYDFFHKLGAKTVGFNVDEIEGINRSSSMDENGFFERLSAFWGTMLRTHFEHRAFQLREADTLVDGIRYGKSGDSHNQQTNPFAILTVAVNGSIGTFSPELLGQHDLRYGDFTIGDIYSHSQPQIASNPRFLKMKAAIEEGVRRCSQQCSYFELCGGGAPSNKINEHGSFDVTETKYCRATKMVIVDSLLKVARPYQTSSIPYREKR